jgi:hypothetical protein
MDYRYLFYSVFYSVELAQKSYRFTSQQAANNLLPALYLL